MDNWDVIIVGGGMVGLSTAYYLSKSGVKTLLLQAENVGGGTSAANAGRAQVNEGSLDQINVRIIREGLARLETLEEELGFKFEWHRCGYLCLIKTQHLWDEWYQRSKVLSCGGIPCELLDNRAVKAAEPNLNTDGLLGAAYSLEGLLNPFLFCWAFAKAARKYGLEIYQQTPVSGFEIQNNKVMGIRTPKGYYKAEKIIVTCGAWTPLVMKMAGVEIPVRHTHAEAMITEPTNNLLNNTIGLADFYEIIHGKEKAVAIGVGPHKNGSLLITEAVSMTNEHHRKNSIWGLSGMAKDLLQIFPVLEKVNILRAWGSPTPFTRDGEPMIGWMPQFENLFVGVGFKQTITAVPVFGNLITKMIMEEDLPYSMEIFSPSRFYPNYSGEMYARAL